MKSEAEEFLQKILSGEMNFVVFFVKERSLKTTWRLLERKDHVCR